MHTHIHTRRTNTHTHTHARTHTHTTHKHTHTHACTHTFTHVHIHTHTKAHTQSCIHTNCSVMITYACAPKFAVHMQQSASVLTCYTIRDLSAICLSLHVHHTAPHRTAPHTRGKKEWKIGHVGATQCHDHEGMATFGHRQSVNQST